MFYARNERLLIGTQQSVLKIQTMCSVMIYLPTSTILFFLVNHQRTFNYSSGVILSNIDFNCAVANIFIFGLASISFHLDWISSCDNTRKKTFDFERLTDDISNTNIEYVDCRNNTISSVHNKMLQQKKWNRSVNV